MMGTIESLPHVVRDNAGLISVPMAVKPGCRGAACPAFATCQGRCETRRVKLEAGYPGGLALKGD